MIKTWRGLTSARRPKTKNKTFTSVNENLRHGKSHTVKKKKAKQSANNGSDKNHNVAVLPPLSLLQYLRILLCIASTTNKNTVH